MGKHDRDETLVSDSVSLEKEKTLRTDDTINLQEAKSSEVVAKGTQIIEETIHSSPSLHRAHETISNKDGNTIEANRGAQNHDRFPLTS